MLQGIAQTPPPPPWSPSRKWLFSSHTAVLVTKWPSDHNSHQPQSMEMATMLSHFWLISFACASLSRDKKRHATTDLWPCNFWSPITPAQYGCHRTFLLQQCFLQYCYHTRHACPILHQDSCFMAHYDISTIRTLRKGPGQTSAFLNHHSTPSWEWSMSTTRVTHYPLQSLDSSPEKPEKPHAVRRVHKIISYVVITSLLAPSHTVRPKLKMPTVYHLLLTGISEFIQYMRYLYCEHYTNSCQREFSVWSMHVLFTPKLLSLKSILD